MNKNVQFFIMNKILVVLFVLFLNLYAVSQNTDIFFFERAIEHKKNGLLTESLSDFEKPSL